MTLPEVPPNLGYQLEYFLSQIRLSVLKLSKAVDEVGEEGDGGPDNPTANGTLGFTDETPAELANQSTGVEGAWTTLASGAPVDAIYTVIQFRLAGDSDAEGATIERRSADGSPEILVAQIVNTGDSGDVSYVYDRLVPLTETGDFDYLVTVTAGSPDWSIWRVGYVI